MKSILKIEELLQFALALVLFQPLSIGWAWMAGLFLAPDLSMVAYLAGTKAGAAAYNLFHHKGLAIAVYLAGLYLGHEWVQFAGLLLLAHSAFDRVMGYGLKYPDSFQHTHLGPIGKLRAIPATEKAGVQPVHAAHEQE